MKNLYLLLLLLGLTAAVQAQDKIYKKGGEIVEAKITEVGADEIKYRVFGDQSGPMYALDKDRIIKVVYENGRVETYQSNLKDPKLYEDQAKSAIKINFLAPLLGYTQLNYEHSLRPGRAYELSLGLIGIGKRQELGSSFNSTTNTSTTTYRKASGVFLAGGYKLSKLPDFVNKGAKYSHVLQGTYVKPELSFGVYDQNRREGFGTKPVLRRETVTFGGLLINLGKQWVLGDLLLVDLYAGVGYAVDNRDRERGNSEFYYDNFVGNHFALTSGADSGFGVNGGFKIGILINKKK
ncbi:hypothetical protein [Daejeonella sp.]|uniref:hypothetical protein n=1 Tax=Daejeonella sp. TaxID=2805397 RepID=UPI0030C5DAAA